MKTIRTVLYGDFELSEWELEMLHTPIMQRLYNLKQLGLTDKIYPDAVHSRFNHTLGVIERAEKIVKSICKSLSLEKISSSEKTLVADGKTIDLDSLISYVEQKNPVIRKIALLHDIAHIPFGHTFENELFLFSEKHDDPLRQKTFFDILTKEIIYAQIIRHDSSPASDILSIIDKDEINPDEEEFLLENFIKTIERIDRYYQDSASKDILKFLTQTAEAMAALLHLTDYNTEESEKINIKDLIDSLFIVKTIKYISKNKIYKVDFSPTKDMFILDIIGNTICADLLDYSRRDSTFAGLKFDYDDRIFKYFSLANYKKSRKKLYEIRLVLKLFTNKLRHDVVSEIITILRNRYLISERVLFHPTKCAAGAMLGAAIHLAGISAVNLKFYRIGDSEFLQLLKDHTLVLCDIADELVSSLQSNNKQDLLQTLDGNLTQVYESLNAGEKNNLFKQESDSGIQKIDKTQSIIKILEKLSKLLKSEKNEELYPAIQYMINEELFLLKKENVIPETEEKNKSFSNSPSNYILSTLQIRIYAARQLIWQLISRQYYKRIFRISGIKTNLNENKIVQIAEHFSVPQNRFLAEREIERICELPYGSIVLHCPKRETSLKESNVLVIGTNWNNPIPFGKIEGGHELSVLQPYVQAARELENMYKEIWNLYAFVNEGNMDKMPFIEKKIGKVLGKIIECEIENSQELHKELLRTYSGVSKILIDAVESIETQKGSYTPTLNKEYVQFLQNAVHRGFDKEHTIEELNKMYFEKLYTEENNSNKRKSKKF